MSNRKRIFPKMSLFFQLIIMLLLIGCLIAFYFFHPYNNIKIETKVTTADISSESIELNSKDKIYFLSHSNVLYFDEWTQNKVHESFIALDEKRFQFSISEQKIPQAKAVRYYRGFGISKVQSDSLIENYNQYLRKIEIVIPKGQLRFGYLMKE